MHYKKHLSFIVHTSLKLLIALFLIGTVGATVTGCKSKHRSHEIDDEDDDKFVEISGKEHDREDDIVYEVVFNLNKNAISYGTNEYTFVPVESGSFTMGAYGESYPDSRSTEAPAHEVYITENFNMGTTEVPQWLWVAVMGYNPSITQGDNLPVTNVSWNECNDFINKLNALTGGSFSLPTEAQWEYAARGGILSDLLNNRYSGGNDYNAVAWVSNNAGSIMPVGTKEPNTLGLYDMSGNVWEWVNDWYSNYSYDNEINPAGPSSGSTKVGRGGSYKYNEKFSRLSSRAQDLPSNANEDLGFRLVMN